MLCAFHASLVFCGMSLFSSKFAQAITLWITVWFTQSQILGCFGAASARLCLCRYLSCPAAAPACAGGWAGLPRAGYFHKVILSDGLRRIWWSLNLSFGVRGRAGFWSQQAPKGSQSGCIQGAAEAALGRNWIPKHEERVGLPLDSAGIS